MPSSASCSTRTYLAMCSTWPLSDSRAKRRSVAHSQLNARLDRELCNLGLAVANGGDVPTIVAEIRKRETRKAEIDRVLTRPVIDRDGLRQALEAKLEEWKRLLRSRPTHGQTALRTCSTGRSRSALRRVILCRGKRSPIRAACSAGSCSQSWRPQTSSTPSRRSITHC
jgi:hypothetical protein